VTVIVMVMVFALCLGAPVKTAFTEIVVISLIVQTLFATLILTQSRFNIVHIVVKTASVTTKISQAGANVLTPTAYQLDTMAKTAASSAVQTTAATFQVKNPSANVFKIFRWPIANASKKTKEAETIVPRSFVSMIAPGMEHVIKLVFVSARKGGLGKIVVFKCF